MLRKSLTLEVLEEKISVSFHCNDTIMMMNKDNNDTREKAEAYFDLKMLEKVREGANCDSNGFEKKDWLDIVRGFNLLKTVFVKYSIYFAKHSIPFITNGKQCFAERPLNETKKTPCRKTVATPVVGNNRSPAEIVSIISSIFQQFEIMTDHNISLRSSFLII